MQESRRFSHEEDEAVSPVIGVILMVAITVVLAAVAFVLVGQLGADTGQPSQASFQTDRSGAGGELLVVRIGAVEIDAAKLTINPGTCSLQDAAGAAKSSGTLDAGDKIVCTADGDVTVVDDGTGTLLFAGKL